MNLILYILLDMPINIPSQIPALTIDRMLPSLSSSEARLINDQIISVDNLISINISDAIQSQKNQSFAPRLMNWVEPYSIYPYTYSLFYTEVNSNLKVGDRVFIVGGNYDSDTLISIDKYAKGADGYRVLYIDRCKLALEIDYTGAQVWSADDFDKYIKIYAPKTQEQFDYYVKMTSASDTSESISKFSKFHGNIIYTYQAFSGISVGLGKNLGVTGSGFHVLQSSGAWLDVTADFTSNTFTSSVVSNKYINNDKLWIVDDFNYSGQDFLNTRTYTYGSASWTVDSDFRPVVGKSNFRNGNFLSGKFNGGIYGQQNTQLVYDGTNIEWNTGTLFNVLWSTGQMSSTIYNINSYLTELDINGIPYQKSIPQNNNGYGYNYIIDSTFLTSTIGYGNFFTSRFGTQSAIDPVVYNYLKGYPDNWSKTLVKGVFTDCQIIDCLIQECELKYSDITNCRLEETKSINSIIKDSAFIDNSIFTTENSIQILGYDNWTFSCDSISYSVHKFYISDTDYGFFKTFDNFYFSGVDILNSPSQSIINYFDKRYILNSYLESDDYFNLSTYSVQLSSTLDNRYGPTGSTGVSLYSRNTNSPVIQRSSIDILVEEGVTMSVSNVDVSNAYIWNSDFNSGIFDGSNWVQANLINLTFDNHILSSPTASPNGNHMIDFISATHLGIYVGMDFQIPGHIQIGDPIFINGLNYLKSNKNYALYSNYLVENITTYSSDVRIIEVSEILTGTQASILSTLTNGGAFSVLGVSMSNNWINKVKFNNSTINSGFLKHPIIENSNFNNIGFNSSDFEMSNLDNLKSLLISDILISNNGNEVDSGLFYNSVFLSGTDIWNSGFFYNSYWNGKTQSQIGSLKRNTVPFSGGTFRESEWLDGIFNNGYFYKNQSNGTGSSVFNNGVSEYFLTDNIRYSWINGVFNLGTFSKSNWESGYFKGGNLFNSNFFLGTMSGGHFGSDNVPFQNTQMWSGVILGGIVDNGYLFGQDPTFPIISSATWSIDWRNGLFLNGQFGNDYTNSRTEAIWKDGQFSGGQFINMARWLTGTFSGGRFLSTWGWTMSNSILATDYTWQSGQFNGGYFGNASQSANSTWYTGQFNGGHFQGRVWNNGILTSGYFDGSGLGSAAINPNDFINFSGYLNGSYYGLWRDGLVTDVKNKFIKDQKIWTNLQRNHNKKKITPQVEINNIAWLSGTFSHPNGEINNSVWFDGSFEDGYFYSSSFNPYIVRPIGGSLTTHGATAFNMNDSTCYWNNGQLEESTFYFSKWNNGEFISGTAWGMIWLDGVVDYMNAYNCYWGGGLWKNGNWDGSPFDYRNIQQVDIFGSTVNLVIPSLISTDGSFATDILHRISLYQYEATGVTGTDIHIINAFTYSEVANIFDYISNGIFSNWTINSGALDLLYLYPTAPSDPSYYIQLLILWIFVFPIQYGVLDSQFYIYQSTSATGSSNSSFAFVGSTTSVFQNAEYNYNISMDIGVRGQPTDTATIRYRIGNLPYVEHANLSTGNVYWPDATLYPPGTVLAPFSTTVSTYQVYSFNEVYSPTDTDIEFSYGKQFEIWKESGNAEIAILNFSIEKIKVQYLTQSNNKLITAIGGTYSGPIAWVDPLQLTTNGSNGMVSIKFGNGQFLAGIWENGVWNNGWRQDDTVQLFDIYDPVNNIFKAVKYDPSTWRVYLSVANPSSFLNGNTTKIQPGDNISVGNLVAIDINENRRLIANFLKVIDVVYDTTLSFQNWVISFTVQTNFPIRRFEKDSESHLLYATKNIWLNGLFLNGKFNKGVWSNGLFKGWPDITAMKDTHWIDGTFDGGHYEGLTASYLNVQGNISEYHTGVIQKFIFYDKNIRTPYVFKYGSWIDVNYFTSSGVNLNRPNKVYKETPIGFTASYTENNLYGYPTVDVLESVSYIRDGYTSLTNSYSLGWKAKKYTDYVSPFGASDFTDIISSDGLYIGGSTVSGVENFIEAGWTYSDSLVESSTHTHSTYYQANYGLLDSNKLYISSDNVNRNAPPSPSDLSWFKLDSIENLNTLEIPKGRYTVIEVEVDQKAGHTANGFFEAYKGNLLFFNNYPATYSIPFQPILFSDRLISAPVNMLTSPGAIKREYFFNKPSLQMEIFSGATISLAFNRISFIEVDMIPFLQIMSDDIGRFRFLNWEEDERAWGDPPYLDGATETEINLWENVYRIDHGGTGSTNINHDVQDPYFAMAPGVDYSNPNFRYLSSILVGIDTLNNSIE